MEEIKVIHIGRFCVQVTSQYRPSNNTNTVICYFFVGSYPGKKDEAKSIREYDINFSLYYNIQDECESLEKILFRY
jgi:hypothetical protein